MIPITTGIRVVAEMEEQIQDREVAVLVVEIVMEQFRAVLVAPASFSSARPPHKGGIL